MCWPFYILTVALATGIQVNVISFSKTEEGQMSSFIKLALILLSIVTSSFAVADQTVALYDPLQVTFSVDKENSVKVVATNSIVPINRHVTLKHVVLYHKLSCLLYRAFIITAK